MAKYRKKPVIVEAVQFFKDGPIPDGVKVNVDCLHGKYHPDFYIDTLEGRMTVTEGDYIITGVQGEKYPVKEHIFLETYEPVEE
jgi:hypothetical protein